VEGDGGTYVAGAIGYKILTATGTQSATFSYGATSGAKTHAAAIAVFKGVGAATQSAVPTSDITTTNWTSSLGGSLYAAIDEASPGSDTDYIYTDTAASYAEVKYGSLTDPASSSGHIVKVRILGDGTSGIKFELRQGSSTSIASKTVDPAPSTWTADSFTLTSGEADSISDYTDLRIRFTEV
jgi:hypothetical protein